VRACTADAAASYFADSRLGTLEAGKLADVVVLANDLFEASPEGIAETAVDATVVGGNVAFASGALPGLG
jgi:hypothetical protein